MSEKHGALRIHTQLTPEPAAAAPAPVKTRRKRRVRLSRPRASYGDRLLRNSAIACAALLGILALGNIRQPWAEKAADSIERALTMRINLDESFGDLTFVRQIMPESALVFLNISGGPELTSPVEGELTHPWQESQPWLLYACEAGSPVYADGAGTVSAVSKLSDDGYGLLIDHGGGLESVYANLEEVSVHSGDTVARGQQLGTGSERLYFEYRVAGEPADPSGKLGL